MAFKKIEPLSQEGVLRAGKLFAKGGINVYLYCLTAAFNKINEIIAEMDYRRTELIKLQTENEKLRKEILKKVDALTQLLSRGKF